MNRIINKESFKDLESFYKAREAQESKIRLIQIRNKLENIFLDLELSKTIDNYEFVNCITKTLNGINKKLKEA